MKAREKTRTRTKSRPFVGLDGEGAGSRYILLACGNGEWIGRKKGLSTQECLDFLLDLPNGSSAGTRPIYVWFAFDYDVNMMLRDLNREELDKLRTENYVNWRGYRITYFRRKILRIRHGKRRHFSTDIWGYFQGSFERSLADWGIESNEIIQKGKAARGGFDKWTLAAIREYNDEELKLLAILAEKLRDSVAPLQLPMRSWHGPASLAGAWLTKNRVKRFWDETPASIYDAVTRAYFGGRIDTVGYGIVDPVYHYDIVSAYPSATRNLPNLEKLTWIPTKKKPRTDGLYLSRVIWNDKQDRFWYPFPWRWKDGSILFPRSGHSWLWNYEFEAGLRKFPDLDYEIRESFSAVGDYEYPFRQLISDTFKYRAELKRTNQPSHIAVKLILNSLYGKFAQTVGRATYYSGIWAGLITAQTRAQILDVLSEDTMLIMTDSVWSSKPLDVPIANELGAWEESKHVRAWIAQAGFYEAEDADGKRTVYQRGLDKRKPISISELVEKWIYKDDTYSPTFSVNRFVGMGLASITSYPWRHFVEMKRQIAAPSLVGTSKREPVYPLQAGEVKPTGSFIRLQPRNSFGNNGIPFLSFPYSKLTLDPELARQQLEDGEIEDDF